MPRIEQGGNRVVDSLGADPVKHADAIEQGTRHHQDALGGW